MQEIWVPIPGHEKTYEVSNLGQVRSLPRRLATRWGPNTGRQIPMRLKSFSKHSQGYCAVHMYEGQVLDKQYVHRLVAQAFISNPEKLPQVNHRDGDKSNNAAENLEWCSGSKNCQHAVDTQLYEMQRGEANGHAVLTESDVVMIRELASKGMLHREIASLVNVGRKAVTKIVNRQRWKHL